MKKIIVPFMKVIISLSIVGICCSVEANESDEQQIGLGVDKMHELKQAYTKLQQSIQHFLEVNRNAEKKHPGLAAVETGLLRMKHTGSQGFPGKKEYQVFFNASNENKKIFDSCRGPFIAKFYADAVKDPNWGAELKPLLLFRYRNKAGSPLGVRKEAFVNELKKNGFTVFEPNDPNDERLWGNIKKYAKENSDFYEQQRENFVEEKGVPKIVAEYAGYLTYKNQIANLKDGWLLTNTPKEIIDALREIGKNLEDIMRIDPQWISIEHLLTDKNMSIDPKAMALLKEYPYGQIRKFLSGESNRLFEDEGLNNKMLIPFMYELISEMLGLFNR